MALGYPEHQNMFLFKALSWKHTLNGVEVQNFLTLFAIYMVVNGQTTAILIESDVQVKIWT